MESFHQSYINLQNGVKTITTERNSGNGRLDAVSNALKKAVPN